MPLIPPIPLFGSGSDAPIRGYSTAPARNTDCNLLKADDRGERWAYRDEPDSDLHNLQQEARTVAEKGLCIFDTSANPHRGKDSKARRATYARLQHQTAAWQQKYGGGHLTDLPCLVALAARRLDEVSRLFPGKEFSIAFAGYIHRHPDLCLTPQALHRDLDMESNDPTHLYFSDFTLVEGVYPPGCPQGGYFVPRSVDGLPCPWHEMPMPGQPGRSLIIDSMVSHAGGAQQPGLQHPGCVAVVAITTNPNTDYSHTSPMHKPLWARDQGLLNTPPAGPAEGKMSCPACGKAKSSKGASFCSGCSMKTVCAACADNGTNCDFCQKNPGWHFAHFAREARRRVSTKK